MNIRSIYLFLIVVLSLGLFFEWSSEKKDEAINNTIKNIDNALRREGHEEMWPKKLTEQY